MRKHTCTSRTRAPTWPTPEQTVFLSALGTELAMRILMAVADLRYPLATVVLSGHHLYNVTLASQSTSVTASDLHLSPQGAHVARIHEPLCPEDGSLLLRTRARRAPYEKIRTVGCGTGRIGGGGDSRLMLAHPTRGGPRGDRQGRSNCNCTISSVLNNLDHCCEPFSIVSSMPAGNALRVGGRLFGLCRSAS